MLALTPNQSVSVYTYTQSKDYLCKYHIKHRDLWKNWTLINVYEIHHGDLVYKEVIVLITDVAGCLWQLFCEKFILTILITN